MEFVADTLKSSAAGRQPLLQNTIYKHFSDLILQRRLKPGDRLPIRDILVDEFQTTKITVQRAIDQLVCDGFLRTVARKGSFVAQKPPCFHKFGIVFPFSPKDSGWRGLDTSIMEAAVIFEKKQELSFRIYHNAEGNTALEEAVRNQLDQDLKIGRIGGLIFATHPHYMLQHYAVTTDNFPRISIQKPVASYPFPCLNFDSNAIIHQGVQKLAKSGCRKIALLTRVKDQERNIERFQSALANNHLIYEPAWVQGCDLSAPKWAANIIRLMLHPGNTHPPDGLLILDDTFTPYVIEGIEQCPCQIRQDLRIIAHANFPAKEISSFPVERMGFDICDLLRQALDSLVCQQSGKPYKKFIQLEAKLESEVLY